MSDQNEKRVVNDVSPAVLARLERAEAYHGVRPPPPGVFAEGPADPPEGPVWFVTGDDASFEDQDGRPIGLLPEAPHDGGPVQFHTVRNDGACMFRDVSGNPCPVKHFSDET